MFPSEQPPPCPGCLLAEQPLYTLTPSGPQLSPPEREVLQLLADGLGAPAIARQLHIRQSTTRTHRSKLYGQLGAANRAPALSAAMNLGRSTSPGPTAGPGRAPDPPCPPSPHPGPNMPFRIRGLDPARFGPLLSMRDEELARHRARIDR